MKEVSTNPLNALTKEELNEFRKAIDKNFSFIEIKEKIIEAYNDIVKIMIIKELQKR